MSSIPQERKQSILNKLLSANPPTVSTLSQQEGVSEATLYNWRKQLRLEGRAVPEPDRTSENWSAATKFAVVVETAALSETELAEHCRSKGLYPEQVKAWRDAAISAQDSSAQAAADKQEQARDYRKQIKRLEREIGKVTASKPGSKHWALCLRIAGQGCPTTTRSRNRCSGP